MEEHNQQPLDTLQDIKRIMERSSRFISLSGLSGVAAGICALAGAWFAQIELGRYNVENGSGFNGNRGEYIFKDGHQYLRNNLLLIAVITFAAAFILSFFFTYLRSKKTNTPVWDRTARRVMINVAIPMVAGGIYLLALVNANNYAFIAPGCLLFYGLALVNASKYTLNEIRYLGYTEILLGLINCWATNYSLLCWAIGFGVLHIIYGVIMWWRYERKA
jgi:hypothetical protein